MQICLLLCALAIATTSCTTGFNGLNVPGMFNKLNPQQYTWYPERSPAGPVVIFVSIPRQDLVVYRNGVRIGRCAVSTGRDGHQTPTGVFQILEKDVDHHSKTYGNAPMPYMERLTWDGVALHAGYNPGHPASHGCVRMPLPFAQKLYTVTNKGGTVVISNSTTPPALAMGNGLSIGGPPVSSPVWKGTSGNGPVSVVVSTTTSRIRVFQNGKLIGASPIQVTGSMANYRGESVFVNAGGNQWHSIEGAGSFAGVSQGLLIPPNFGRLMYQAIRPGTTMVITSEPITTQGARSTDLLQ